MNSAVISSCGTYRYELRRTFAPELAFTSMVPTRPLVTCILNPSKADAIENDPTVTRVSGFAKRWGCGWLLVTNADAYRETFPSEMIKAAKSGVDICGPENDDYIRRARDICIENEGIFLVGWGANLTGKVPGGKDRQKRLAELIGDIAMCLGVNKDGSPEHPLYIPYERPLKPWRCP